ncbi:MFS transporter [Arthrobacter sp. Soc17.1.1.1]|uniref:MFS transporter n=1 Tax=Arthrobacter sp. Soc17.1.1.1 TaxID=3121277 RepID=UPI002FE4BA22
MSAGSAPTVRRPRIHPAWIVAAVAFLTLVGAAGFRAAPSVLMVPLEEEFGWSRGVLSLAVSINLVLFGLTAPFAAALMERFGIRRITSLALLVIGAGSALTVLVREPWQILLTWGVLIGLGTGSIALVFAATVASTWFVRRRGLVVGILTAGSAAGQLVFLPVMAALVDTANWRVASLVIAAGALAVIPLVLVWLHDAPADIGARPYGEPPGDAVPASAPAQRTNAAARALRALRTASHHRTFWALAGGFAICGATTNGLIGTHFIPSAHDHGMSTTTAAGLLALVGVFDIVGTIASGWLTDRYNPKVLLAVYYLFRGISLFVLPALLAATVQPPMIIFIVIYGLDWVATVPPTVALCRSAFGADGPLVFGWVFAAHQLGAAAAAVGAGFIRDTSGEYTIAWFGAAALCAVAALLTFLVRRDIAQDPGASAPVGGARAAAEAAPSGR